MSLDVLAEQAVLLYTLVIVIILSVLLCLTLIPLWVYFLIIAFIIPAEVTALTFTKRLIKAIRTLNRRIKELEKE